MLKGYLPSLWLFLSLSGPHLGYLCSANKLFCSGMWLFKKFTAGALQPHLYDCATRAQKLGPNLDLACTSNPAPMSHSSSDADNRCVIFDDLDFEHWQSPTGEGAEWLVLQHKRSLVFVVPPGLPQCCWRLTCAITLTSCPAACSSTDAAKPVSTSRLKALVRRTHACGSSTSCFLCKD